mmetsp:Transcript_4873/g.11829  ORF Transcript_4873/g.11829 Transcript_4873/m.11829 type:complete len:211 (-) Transcript_4873:144-776(-)
MKQSREVMTTPAHSGMKPRLRMLKAMALPMTSWMSLPMMAISVWSQSMWRGSHGYSFLQCSARSNPVATPRRAASICSMNPMRVERRRSHRRVQDVPAPACRSLSRFPGSTYAIDIRSPGPRNARSFLKENHPRGFCPSSPSSSLSSMTICDMEWLPWRAAKLPWSLLPGNEARSPCGRLQSSGADSDTSPFALAVSGSAILQLALTGQS